MADAGSLAGEPQMPKMQSKFMSHFLWKAAISTLVLFLHSLLPLLAPESLTQTLHGRNWELLQLILVGIAVSYGLFSKKNDESGKDHHGSMMDNAQSYFSRLLQASSVFDDETNENPVEIDENKVQAWSSQYYREEPVFVVANENSPIDEDDNSEGFEQKPLLLPLRTLKKGISDSEQNEVNLSSDSTKQRNVDCKINAPSSRDQALKQRITNSCISGSSVGTFISNEPVEKKIEIDSPSMLLGGSDDEGSESESDVDYDEGISAAADDRAVADAGPDVDRKADEFIAKFREQIRLQRIQSIRRPAAHRR